MVTWLYPDLYCAVVPLFIVVERIAVTSAVHEWLLSQVVEHAEHYNMAYDGIHRVDSYEGGMKSSNWQTYQSPPYGVVAY